MTINDHEKLNNEPLRNSFNPEPIRTPTFAEVNRKLRQFDAAKIMENYFKENPDKTKPYAVIPKLIRSYYEVEVSQAEHVVKRFGGVRTFLEALSSVGKTMNRSTIYRWRLSKEKKGTGGVVPSAVWPYIFKAAKIYGVYLSSEDADPRIRHFERHDTLAVIEDGKILPYLNSKEIWVYKTHKRRKAEKAARRKAKKLALKLKQLEGIFE